MQTNNGTKLNGLLQGIANDPEAGEWGDWAKRLLSDGTLTVAAVTKEFGIGRSTLYRLMADGVLPYTSLGARRLIPRNAVIELLAKNLIAPEREQ